MGNELVEQTNCDGKGNLHALDETCFVRSFIVTHAEMLRRITELSTRFIARLSMS
jgi:hypothetical protein